MSMQTLNVIQFIQLLTGYLGFTVGLPALVFYKKVKRFPVSAQFLIYFTIGNFYVINLVQALTLLHISYRITLFLCTVIPAILASIYIYQLAAVTYFKNLFDDCRHYLLRELGIKSFLLRRIQEIFPILRAFGKAFARILREVYQDIPFLVLFVWLIWQVCGNGLLNNWGYGASDLPVHNYWINGLIDNNIYIAGVYPMGMHCMLYYLATMLNIPVYVTLRLFWLIQFGTVAFMVLLFLKGCCRNRFLPYLGAYLYVASNLFVSASYLRFGATLPQEYGVMYILPSIFFAMQFLQYRKEELENGENYLLCTSTWMLLGFAMSFSLTFTAHFYDAIIAGLICICIVIGYGYWFWRKEYLLRVIFAGVLSILFAFLPMAAALLTGKAPQGSMYWAMNVIGLRDYTVLIFRIICFTVIALTIGGIVIIIRGIRSGKISFENQKIPMHSKLGKTILLVITLLPQAAMLLLGWKYRENILWGSGQLAMKLPNMKLLLYGAGIIVVIALILRFVWNPLKGAGIFSMTFSVILLGLLTISGSLGWPMLMEPARTCIYFAYMFPVVIIMGLDGAVDVLLFSRVESVQQILGLLLTVLLFFNTCTGDKMRGQFGGGQLEMNEAILCTTNILYDNLGQNDTWTIVSANDELRMTEHYGRHTETIEFLSDMEYWNPTKEILIPTEKVYFYIEKQPINYAGGYGGTIPAVSVEEAEKPLPKNSGMSAYTGTNRAITMSRMYYWAQQFMELYPNEMKVYFENDNFVCYYIEQNVYRLYNFAIQYGYN